MSSFSTKIFKIIFLCFLFLFLWQIFGTTRYVGAQYGYPVGGQIKDCACSSRVLPNVSVGVYNAAGTPRSVTTDASGRFIVPTWIPLNTQYGVRPNLTPPAGYTGAPKSQTGAASFNRCLGTNTPINSPSYLCQLAGSIDCAVTYLGTANRCHFCYSPSVPNCKNMTGPTNTVLDRYYRYQITYENTTGPVTQVGFFSAGNTCFIDNQNRITGAGTQNWDWKAGPEVRNYILSGRVWNGNIAQALGVCVNPADCTMNLAAGPNCTLNVNVFPPLPCPTCASSCSCSGNTAMVNLSWNPNAQAAGYLVRINASPFDDWKNNAGGDKSGNVTGSSISTDVTPGIPYEWHTQPYYSWETYPYGSCVPGYGGTWPCKFNCPACPTSTPTPTPTPTPTSIPVPPVPNATCGTYDIGTGTTPITWDWSPIQASGLQVKDTADFGFAAGTWWFNTWANPPLTVSSVDNLGLIPGIPPGRVVYGRTTYNFIGGPFSDSSSITCPVPTSTPTPTVTPTPTAGPWYKLKNASFNKLGALTNPIPALIKTFDASGVDTSQRMLIANDIGSPGNDPGVVVNGLDSPDLNGASLSIKNWGVTYSPRIFDPNNFINYVKSRKKYATITDLNDIVDGKINILSPQDLNLNTQALADNIADLNNILIVQGNVTINIPSPYIFNSAKNPVVIMATGDITFGEDMLEANGIFIANKIVFSDAVSTTPLKIQGNIISKTELATIDLANRARTDNSRPSIFIVFDPAMYLNLLPYLSTSTYDWKQLQ